MTCELCYSIAYYAGETAAGSFAYRVCDEKKGSLGDLPADLPGDFVFVLGSLTRRRTAAPIADAAHYLQVGEFRRHRLGYCRLPRRPRLQCHWRRGHA